MKHHPPRTFPAFLLALALAALLLATNVFADGKITIACVGDSITEGFGIKDPQHHGYPDQLQALLGDGYAVLNCGRSGATMLVHGDSPYVKAVQYTYATKSHPQIVVIMLGTNDSKASNWVKKAAFADDTKALVEHFAGLDTKPKVWLCLPAPAFSGAYGISGPVIKDEILPLVKQAAEAEKAGVIDVYNSLTDKKALFPDGIHPNEEGLGVIAKTVAAEIKK